MNLPNHKSLDLEDPDQIESFLVGRLKSKVVEDDIVNQVEREEWKRGKYTRMLLKAIQVEKNSLSKAAQFNSLDGDNGKAGIKLVRISELEKVVGLILNNKYEQ